MADTDNVKEAKNFYPEVPTENKPFFLKGSNALDWGMQNRLSRVFNPQSGRTVMLAIDHGYFMGPTTGLERVDISIVPLICNCTALMLTRGMLRSTIPSSFFCSFSDNFSSSTFFCSSHACNSLDVINDSLKLLIACIIPLKVSTRFLFSIRFVSSPNLSVFFKHHTSNDVSFIRLDVVDSPDWIK